jgi:hypothetical protein
MNDGQQKMPVVMLDSKRVAEIQENVPRLVAQASEFQIVRDNDEFIASGAVLLRLDEREKQIVDFFDEPAKQANNVHKFITTLRATLLRPVQQASAMVKGSRQTYRAEQERVRLQKEEEAREAAKLEQEKLALQQAAQMEEIGETEAANIIIDRAVAAPPPPVVIPSTIPKEQGISVRKVYKHRVTNPALHKREFLMLDESKVKAIVSKLGPDAVAIVGGIEVYAEDIESVRQSRQR